MSENTGAKVILWGIVLLVGIVLFFIFKPFTIISAGERGVVTRNGAVNRMMEPGIHYKTPLFEHVISMDVTTQKEEIDVSAASKDLQSVNTKIALNYALQADKVDAIYTDLRSDYSDRVVAPAIQEAVKSATARYTAEELITKREEVKAVIVEDLKKRLTPRFIIVQDLLITNFDFSEQFNTAIESKVRAEQDALASKNKLEQTKYEAEQTVTKAKAEAESIRIQAQAITQQGGAEYVRLKTVEKWNGAGCTQYCGLESSTGLLITK